MRQTTCLKRAVRRRWVLHGVVRECGVGSGVMKRVRLQGVRLCGWCSALRRRQGPAGRDAPPVRWSGRLYGGQGLLKSESGTAAAWGSAAFLVVFPAPPPYPLPVSSVTSASALAMLSHFVGLCRSRLYPARWATTSNFENCCIRGPEKWACMSSPFTIYWILMLLIQYRDNQCDFCDGSYFQSCCLLKFSKNTGRLKYYWVLNNSIIVLNNSIIWRDRFWPGFLCQCFLSVLGEKILFSIWAAKYFAQELSYWQSNRDSLPDFLPVNVSTAWTKPSSLRALSRPEKWMFGPSYAIQNLFWVLSTF